MPYIIRNQGFFYTDEYYSPEGKFRQVVREVFATKAAAQKACDALIRAWVKRGPIKDWTFDDNDAHARVVAYLKQEWPDDFDRGDAWDVEVPSDATDEQVDEIVKRIGVTFAQVFEVASADRPTRSNDELDYGPDGSEEW